MKSQRLRLSGAAFVLLGVWQAIGTGALLAPTLLYVYAATLPLLVLVLELDRRSFTSLGPSVLSASVPHPLDLDQSYVAQFCVSWSAPPVGRQRSIHWEAPSSGVLTWKDDSRSIKLRAGESKQHFEVAFTASSLGREPCGSARLVQASAAGLWTRAETVAVQTTELLHVIPARLLVPAQVFAQVVRDQAPLRLGERRSLRSRAPDQFHSVRKYQFPDPFRHIDQKKSARYQKLMTRTFETYHQHNLVIVLDLGRSMSGRLGQSAKRDFYLAAASSLAENALRSRDRVSFLAFDEEIRARVPPSTSMTSLRFLTTDDPCLAVRQAESNYELIGQGLRALGLQRSIVVLLTDVARPSVQNALVRSLGDVCQRHLTVAVSLIDREFDVDAVALSASGAPLSEKERADLLYAYWLQQEFAVFRGRFSRLGGGVVTCQQGHWIDMVKRIYATLRVSERA